MPWTRTGTPQGFESHLVWKELKGFAGPHQSQDAWSFKTRCSCQFTWQTRFFFHASQTVGDMKPHHGLEAVIPSLNARQQPGHSPRKNQLANQPAGQPTNHNQPTNQSTNQLNSRIDRSIHQSLNQPPCCTWFLQVVYLVGSQPGSTGLATVFLQFAHMALNQNTPNRIILVEMFTAPICGIGGLSRDPVPKSTGLPSFSHFGLWYAPFERWSKIISNKTFKN